ncbi:hypothetical protein F4604DRAFT_1940117 [Suillus subluteus]|nr:hypothetical protein F4604DRAFT_1940117 [Suillus subluteus]
MDNDNNKPIYSAYSVLIILSSNLPSSIAANIFIEAEIDMIAAAMCLFYLSINPVEIYFSKLNDPLVIPHPCYASLDVHRPEFTDTLV